MENQRNFVEDAHVNTLSVPACTASALNEWVSVVLIAVATKLVKKNVKMRVINP